MHQFLLPVFVNNSTSDGNNGLKLYKDLLCKKKKLKKGVQSSMAVEEKWPAVVKHAFKDLQTVGVEDGEPIKWRATCRHCNTVLIEKYCTTSAFTK